MNLIEIFRALRDTLAHIIAGSDWDAPLPVRLERDFIHFAAGALAGLSGWGGALYLWVGLRKQDEDAADPRAKRDSWVDKGAIGTGTVLGWALLALLFILGGPWIGLAVAAVVSVVTLALMVLAVIWRRA